jgi:2-phospho-L-lactate/phosphoenolpyruvate guanylyltransferase
MRTLAILPIKSFGAAKQRLSGLLGNGSRQALAQAMFLDVLASLRRVPGIDAVAVVTANGDAEVAARRGGVHLLSDPDEAGQSAAAQIGIRHGLELGFERVLLVPGDTPLIESGEVAMMLQRSEEEGTAAVIVPDRHLSGTNALLLSPADVIAPSFGPNSLHRHREAAATAGIEHRVEAVASLMLDVDTPDDLTVLAATLDERRGQACMTRGALRQLDRSKVRPGLALAS